MGMHYLIQGIFVLVGLTALILAIGNWDWFFKAQNTQFIVSNVGRTKTRLFYAAIGVLMIATGIYFFLTVQEMI